MLDVGFFEVNHDIAFILFDYVGVKTVKAISEAAARESQTSMLCAFYLSKCPLYFMESECDSYMMTDDDDDESKFKEKNSSIELNDRTRMKQLSLLFNIPAKPKQGVDPIVFRTQLCLVHIDFSEEISSTILRAALCSHARGYARVYDIDEDGVNIVIVCQGSENRLHRFNNNIFEFFDIKSKRNNDIKIENNKNNMSNHSIRNELQWYDVAIGNSFDDFSIYKSKVIRLMGKSGIEIESNASLLLKMMEMMEIMNQNI